jgi:eukaryotic-like serine/threonine-protein kinase
MGHKSSFGPYEIRGPLGQGGGGEVYRAWDPRLQREVALKILRGRAEADPERVRRFVAEARAASALNHPHIVVVFDAAVDGGTPYIVSELIDGQSLAQEIRRGPVPLKRLLDLATQIADGLAEAHAAGIVHCDLKPENIMVSRAGRAKILDFGLVRPAGFRGPGIVTVTVDDQTITAPELLGGTVPYMSPEQARGLPIDFRSDQFSLGLILYEMATGRPALRRATPAETLEAITHEEPAPLPALNPRLPLQLRWIIERCLAKDPRDRYGVTADLHHDLRLLRDRLPEVARETRSAPAVSRRRAAWTGALLVVAAFAATGLGVLLMFPPQPDLTALRLAPFATEAAYEGFPAWSPDGRTVAYTAEKDGVLQIFTRRRNSPAGVPITSATADCTHPFWSPDGRRVYYVSLARDREGIWSVPAAGGVAQLVVPDASRGAISSDGRTLAFLRHEGREDAVGSAAVWLSDLQSADPPRRYERSPFGDLRFVEADLSFSPDGRRLAVAAVPVAIGLQPDQRGWQLWLLPMRDAPPARTLEWLPETVPRLAGLTWMPDSRHVVLGRISDAMSRPQLWLADVDRNRAWPITQGTTSFAHPSASSTGEVVFTAGEPQYDLVQIALDGSTPPRVIATSRNESDPVWSARANAYAYVTDRSGRDEIWLRTGEAGGDERPLVTHADFQDRTIMLGSPAFSPDGRYVAYQRNAGGPVWPLRIWYSPSGGGTPVPLLPESHEGYQGAPTWSPDGEWLAFAEWNREAWRLIKVRVHGDAAAAEAPVVLRSDGVANAAPQWSPSGEWITWETDEGSLVVSPDADGNERRLGLEQWLAHTWSPDGSRVYAVQLTDSRTLSLVAIDVRSGRARVLADLGPSPAVNNPLKGLSVGPGGRTLVTAMPGMQGDLWVLEGLRPPRGLLDRVTMKTP